MAHIYSVLTDVPSYTLTQMEFYDHVAPVINPRYHNIFKRILDGSQIRKRHFCTSMEHVIEMTTNNLLEDKFKVWKEASTEFFQKQVLEILEESGLKPSEIDGICTSTTSGFVTPDHTVILQAAIGLRPDILRLPLMGFGCSGGLAAIHRVKEYLEGCPDKAILVCVGESCAIQYEDPDSVSLLVSNSIFGDGFGTMLMVGRDHRLAKTSQVELLNSKSHIFPSCDFAIGQWMTNDGIHTHLDAKLPKLIKKNVKHPLDKMFSDMDTNYSDIDYWICHAGGPKVMEAFGEVLNLSEKDLEVTMETYRDYGNQSAVSVLTALETTLNSNTQNGLGYLMALGPGIHMEYSLCNIKPRDNKSLDKQKRFITKKPNLLHLSGTKPRDLVES